MTFNAKTIKFIIGFCILGFAFLFVTYLSGCIIIGKHVREYCEDAQSRYPGDCVQALEARVMDEGSSYKDRNSAIWAIGQLGDARAIETLNEIETQAEERTMQTCRLSDEICAYEIFKAKKLVEGGFNATAWVWR